MPHEANHINMMNQTTFKFYQVLLDNESGSQMQFIGFSVAVLF